MNEEEAMKLMNSGVGPWARGNANSRAFNARPYSRSQRSSEMHSVLTAQSTGKKFFKQRGQGRDKLEPPQRGKSNISTASSVNGRLTTGTLMRVSLASDITGMRSTPLSPPGTGSETLGTGSELVPNSTSLGSCSEAYAQRLSNQESTDPASSSKFQAAEIGKQLESPRPQPLGPPSPSDTASFWSPQLSQLLESPRDSARESTIKSAEWSQASSTLRGPRMNVSTQSDGDFAGLPEMHWAIHNFISEEQEIMEEREQGATRRGADSVRSPESPEQESCDNELTDAERLFRSLRTRV